MVKSKLIADFLKGGVLQPKLVSEALAKKGIIVSKGYVASVKGKLIKNKQLKLKKQNTKIDLVLELVKEGFDNQDIFNILKRKRISINKNYLTFIRRNYEKFSSRTKNTERRNALYFRGKDLKYWAKELNLSKVRIYQIYNQGNLGDRIDGVWKPKQQEVVFNGKTLKEWADELSYSRNHVYNLYKNNTLDSRINGTWKPRENKKIGRIIQGRNMTQWAKLLGITRERVRQLANTGKLEDRIRNLNTTLEV